MPNASPNAVRSPLVVVPCLNEAEHIDHLLRTLLSDPGVADGLVVVADGGSTDGCVETVKVWTARDPRVRLIDNPDRLQSAGVNRAARAFGAGRRWLVRIDAHADYPPDYVAQLIDEAERIGPQSVAVRLDTAGDTAFQRAAAAAMTSLLGTGGADHRMGVRSGWVDHGHHALFDLPTFLALGGYDPTFRCNEDAEFDVRLRASGGRIWLTDRVSVVYYPRSNPLALFRQYFRYGDGRARNALKHRARLKLRQMAPLAVAPAVLIAPFSIYAWPLAAPAAAWAALCVAAGLALAIARTDPYAVGAGPVAMLMHFGWSLGFWRRLLRSAARRSSSAVHGGNRQALASQFEQNSRFIALGTEHHRTAPLSGALEPRKPA